MPLNPPPEGERQRRSHDKRPCVTPTVVLAEVLSWINVGS
ncbi:hypothetical protein COMA2_90110 [Candidatus Nitrospira nitrificans]|uniref:Uncharacterized protein n=1 Tax=Candidatus Nitrospira nitrificans TaxID=1742973 RepID=A0A0S4LVE9_9BACT|nr:hypothetical protein COMA2_90110 [Candidatus Nitrospira nitrificans]